MVTTSVPVLAVMITPAGPKSLPDLIHRQLIPCHRPRPVMILKEPGRMLKEMYSSLAWLARKFPALQLWNIRCCGVSSNSGVAVLLLLGEASSLLLLFCHKSCHPKKVRRAVRSFDYRIMNMSRGKLKNIKIFLWFNGNRNCKSSFFKSVKYVWTFCEMYVFALSLVFPILSCFEKVIIAVTYITSHEAK